MALDKTFSKIMTIVFRFLFFIEVKCNVNEGAKIRYYPVQPRPKTVFIPSHNAIFLSSVYKIPYFITY